MLLLAPIPLLAFAAVVLLWLARLEERQRARELRRRRERAEPLTPYARFLASQREARIRAEARAGISESPLDLLRPRDEFERDRLMDLLMDADRA